MERRDFIKMLSLAGTSAAAYAACSTYMSDALAQSTVVEDLLAAGVECKKGKLADIEHVVILMQENRSFDHYFGTLRGVRGFGDPRPLRLADGEPVWHQPQKDAATQRIKPYRLPRKSASIPAGDNSGTGSAGNVFLQDPAHNYADGLAALNGGRSDKWIPNKDIVTMAHYAQGDIPLYFKLAKAFTVCDAYFCSHNGATDPNRSFFWTGTCKGRTSNSYFSSKNDSVSDTDPSRADWKTYPEELEKIGVDWKFYQDGLTWTMDPFAGNYGDNTLEFFKQYRNKTSILYKKNQTVNSVLRTKADTESQLEKDIREDKLPAVSWISAPEAFTEHPKYPPHFGEYYLNEILRAFAANKDVWHKTVFLINFDENGGFFDHVLPPMPPLVSDRGKTSPGITFESAGNFNSETSMQQADPVGMGIRVPMLVISPFSVGGRVCSEVFDHTSVIRFLDTWLKAKEKQTKDAEVFSNISSWRQAIAGDLTSAFDFNRSANNIAMDKLLDATKPARIFGTSEKTSATGLAAFKPGIADVNADPDAKKPVAAKQDRTRCEILPVGYDFQVFLGYSIHDATGKTRVDWTIRNSGTLGASFYVIPYSRTDAPWLYSVEGVKPGGAPVIVSDFAQITGGTNEGDYEYAIHGPNGYLFEFRGNSLDLVQMALPNITDVKPAADGKKIQFIFDKWPTASGKLKLINAYNGYQEVIENGAASIQITTEDGWYDIAFVDAINDNSFLRRYAGHLENGLISTSDPAIGQQYDDRKRVYVAVTA